MLKYVLRFAQCDGLILLHKFTCRRNIMYKHKAYHLYNGRAYYAAALLIDFPIMLLETLAHAAILYYMIGQ